MCWAIPSSKAFLKSKIFKSPDASYCTSSLLDEVLFHVVTVYLSATEDDGLVHLVLLDGSDRILALQHFDGF